MAKKNTRKKSIARARRKAANTRNKKPTVKKKAAKKPAPPARSACYVAVSPVVVSIRRTRAKNAPSAVSCAGFEGTKDAVLDGLVAAIEEAEQKLAACKRATNVEQLRSL